MPVWAEFVDRAWRTWSGDRPPLVGPLATWRVVRSRVRAELATLGLDASVWTTADGPVPLAQHDGASAGLVLLHRNGIGPDWPIRPPATDQHDHWARMAAAHRLDPVDGLDTDLRRFCGQDARYARLAWVDHARTWVDRDGDPVLTVEPYRFEPIDVVRDLDGLPLRVDGPHPGVWNDGTTLLLLRHDPAADLLPAEPDDPDDADDVAELFALLASLLAAERPARVQLRASVAEPSRATLAGLVASVLAAVHPDGMLRWAEVRLATLEQAGHLDPEVAVTLVARTLDRVELGPYVRGGALDPGERMATARVHAYRTMLGAAADDVRAALGQDWFDRAGALVERWPAVAEMHPEIAVVREWLNDRALSEAYA